MPVWTVNFENARHRGPAGLVEHNGQVVGQVVAQVENRGQQKQARIEIPAPGPVEQHIENPHNRG